MKKRRKEILIIVTILAVLFVILGIYKWINRWNCNRLPSIEQVDQVVKEHKDVVEQIIKEVGGNIRHTEVIPFWDTHSVRDGEKSFYIMFSWGEFPFRCQNTGRGGIEITFPGYEDELIIKKIINGKTFFGIPYKLLNI